MMVTIPKLDATLLGVDLGGSGVRAWTVGEERGLLEVRSGPFERSFAAPAEGPSGFVPVELARQLADHRSGDPGDVRPGEAERAEGARRVALIADALEEAAGGRPLCVAAAAPGLRTADARGIAVMRNGPRIPRLLADLEGELRLRRIELARPLPALIGDAEAAGWGELRARAGSIGDARSALVLVAGSGVAEVLVQAGRALPLEELEPPLARAWEIELAPRAAGGQGGVALSVEDALAPGCSNARWRREGGAGAFEVAAAGGDRAARELVDRTTAALAAHLARRLVELGSHPRSQPLERIVLAGALARMLARDAAWLGALREALGREVAPASLAGSRPVPAAGAPGAIPLVLSSLRAAPAVGAVAARLLGACARHFRRP